MQTREEVPDGGRRLRRRHGSHAGLGGDVLAATQRRRTFKGGKFRQGVLSGDPTPDGITLLTLLDDVTGAGRVRLEVARDPDFRSVVATQDDRHQRPPQPLGEGARRPPQGPRAVLLPLRDADPADPGRAHPDGAAARLQRAVKFAFFSCADYTHGYYNAYGLMRTRTSTSSCASATTSTASPTTRRGRDRGPRRQIGKENPQHTNYLREALNALATTGPSTSSTAPTRRCGSCTPGFPHDHDLGRPRGGRTTTPAPSPRPSRRTRLRRSRSPTPTVPSSSPTESSKADRRPPRGAPEQETVERERGKRLRRWRRARPSGDRRSRASAPPRAAVTPTVLNATPDQSSTTSARPEAHRDRHPDPPPDVLLENEAREERDEQRAGNWISSATPTGRWIARK